MVSPLNRKPAFKGHGRRARTSVNRHPRSLPEPARQRLNAGEPFSTPWPVTKLGGPRRTWSLGQSPALRRFGSRRGHRSANRGRRGEHRPRGRFVSDGLRADPRAPCRDSSRALCPTLLHVRSRFRDCEPQGCGAHRRWGSRARHPGGFELFDKALRFFFGEN